MKHLFESATVKLTLCYVAIITAICLLFSIMVYQVTVGEVEQRLTRYEQQTQRSLPRDEPLPLPGSSIRTAELQSAKGNVIIILLYTNLAILLSGGVISLWFAKRTLRPISELHDQQSQFISDASHELRTPLAAMTTEIEVALRDQTLTKADMRQLLASNLEEVNRLTSLTQTLLVLSRTDSRDLPFAPFSLNDSVTRVVDRFDPQHQQINLTSFAHPDIVDGHQASIEELVSVLVDNAMKYGDSAIPVSISVRKKGVFAVFDITNHGATIPTEHLAHIFDRFYRADSSRTGKNGYGLGLALAKRISDLHAAHLTVKSVDNVTTFCFTLPLVKPKK